MKEKMTQIQKKDVEFRKKTHSSEGWVLTFDDIICLPGYTDYNPVDVDISTNLGPFEFKIPIISASMDTVTEADMAISMALNGGLGSLHRNCPYEKQLEMVKQVKRARSFIIEDVATVTPEMTIAQVRSQMVELGISGFVRYGQRYGR